MAKEVAGWFHRPAFWLRSDEMKTEIAINPIACDGHGICAELLPELIELDEWGFPILKSRNLPPALLDHARRAERLCPTLAVIIREY